jgi:hypothetical protein
VPGSDSPWARRRRYVLCLLPDGEGVWVGTFEQGLWHYDGQQWTHYYAERQEWRNRKLVTIPANSGLPSDCIATLARIGDRLWIGTDEPWSPEGGRLLWFNPRTGKWGKPLRDKGVIELCAEGEKLLVLGQATLQRYDPATNTWEDLSNVQPGPNWREPNLGQFLLKTGDTLWLALDLQVRQLDPTTNQFRGYNHASGLVDGSYTGLAWDGVALWVGSSGGISRVEAGKLGP